MFSTVSFIMSDELIDVLKQVVKKDVTEDVRRRIIGHYATYLCKNSGFSCHRYLIHFSKIR